jgi:hypothetical protein
MRRGDLVLEIVHVCEVGTEAGLDRERALLVEEHQVLFDVNCGGHGEYPVRQLRHCPK